MNQGGSGGADTLVAAVRADLRVVADPGRAAGMAAYFQARPGGYGEGDRFLGVTVPHARSVARRHAGRGAPDDDATVAAAFDVLLASPWHEERLTALMLLVRRYQLAGAATALRRDGEAAVRTRRGAMVRLYLAAREGVDNWDLVDTSAHELLGAWLEAEGALDGEPAAVLRARLARSPRVWDRRIAIISTFASIRAERFAPALEVAELLLDDPHDLIHKAVGWMLREVGNRDLAVEEEFLRVHAAALPRTALRYAIEKLPAEDRRRWLAVKRRA